MPEKAGVVALHPTSAARHSRSESSFVFSCLMVFTFLLFIAPQFIFPDLLSLHLPTVVGGLAVVAYVFDRISCNRPLTVRGPAVRLILSFVALGVLSIPFSYWPRGSLDSLLEDMSRALAICFLMANTIYTARRMKLMVGSMALWAIIMSATAIQEFVGSIGFAADFRIRTYGSPLTTNANDLALTLNLVLALVAGLYFATRQLLPKLVLLATMILFASGVIVTFSRGGFLTLATIVAFLALREVRGKTPGRMVVFVMLVLLLSFLIPSGYTDRLYSMIDFSYDPVGSAPERWKGNGRALRIMLEHPLFGVGFNMDTLATVEKGGGWIDTHNAYLKVGAGLGIPGLVVYLLLIWHVFKAIREGQRELHGFPDARELLALGRGVEVALLAYSVAAFFHSVPFHLYFYYVAGFAIAFREMARRFALQAQQQMRPA